MNAIQVVLELSKWVLGSQAAPKKLPVLIVEDNSGDGAMLKYCVRKLGYVPELQNTVRGAEECLKQQQYRLLILDVAFPSEDGLAFGTRIHFDYPELPIFIVTGTRVYFKRLDGETIYEMPPGKRFSICIKGSHGMALLDPIAEELRANGHATPRTVDRNFALVMLLLQAMAMAIGYLMCLLEFKP